MISRFRRQHQRERIKKYLLKWKSLVSGPSKGTMEEVLVLGSKISMHRKTGRYLPWKVITWLKRPLGKQMNDRWFKNTLPRLVPKPLGMKSTTNLLVPCPYILFTLFSASSIHVSRLGIHHEPKIEPSPSIMTCLQDLGRTTPHSTHTYPSRLVGPRQVPLSIHLTVLLDIAPACQQHRSLLICLKPYEHVIIEPVHGSSRRIDLVTWDIIQGRCSPSVLPWIPHQDPTVRRMPSSLHHDALTILGFHKHPVRHLS